MRGKVVLITGANSGVGFVTSCELAKLGASVLMVCRNPERGAHAVAEVAKVATAKAPQLLLADMSSQAAVRALADNVRRRTAAIDVLINNAGAIFAHRELTAEKAAVALVHLTSSPDLAGVTGKLFLRGKAIKTKPVTHDLEVAARLWRISAELVGLPVDLSVRHTRTPSEPLTRSAA